MKKKLKQHVIYDSRYDKEHCIRSKRGIRLVDLDIRY